MIYLLAHVANLLVTAKLVYHHVPSPYMVFIKAQVYIFTNLKKKQDEIFHIPQAQQYCQGDYLTWDPKLTTPPGL